MKGGTGRVAIAAGRRTPHTTPTDKTHWHMNAGPAQAVTSRQGRVVGQVDHNTPIDEATADILAMTGSRPCEPSINTRLGT